MSFSFRSRSSRLTAYSSFRRRQMNSKVCYCSRYQFQTKRYVDHVPYCTVRCGYRYYGSWTQHPGKNGTPAPILPPQSVWEAKVNEKAKVIGTCMLRHNLVSHCFRMTFDATSNLDLLLDDPLEDEHLSSLQLAAFSVAVILVILLPSCCYSLAPVKDKRE